MRLKSLSSHENTGLLTIRLALGVVFLTKGYPILFGGSSVWKNAGGFVAGIGLDFEWAMLIAGCVLGLFQILGGAGILLGLLTAPRRAPCDDRTRRDDRCGLGRPSLTHR